VAAATLRRLKERIGAKFVDFATDDPFKMLAWPRRVAASLPFYYLYVCTKRAIMDDVRAAGCRQMAFVPFGYEPFLHFPDKFGCTEESEELSSDVVFVGMGDRDRYPHFEALVRGIPGLRLHLYGLCWNRNRTLARYHRGLALGRDFRSALGGFQDRSLPRATAKPRRSLYANLRGPGLWSLYAGRAHP